MSERKADATLHEKPAARPGAMTMAMRAVQVPTLRLAKWLRIAMVRDGRIEHEAVIKPGQKASIGSSERATFVVQGMPSEQPLVEHRDNGYQLFLPADARAKLASGGAPYAIDPSREVRKLALTADTRGRIELAGAVLLFQHVPAIPEPQRPQLPSAVRAGAQVDWTFTSFVAMTFTACLAGVIAMDSADYPFHQELRDRESEDILARIIEMMPEPPPPDVVETGAQAPDAQQDTVVEPPDPTPQTSNQPVAHDRPHTNNGRPDRRPEPGNADADPALVLDQVNAQIALLGSEGPGGAFANLLDGAAVDNAADIMATVDSATIATNDHTVFRRRGDQATTTSPGIDGLRRPATVATNTRDENRGGPDGGPTIRPPTIDMDDAEIPRDDTFDSQLVVRAVRTRIASIQRCYEGELTRSNPSLAGRVTVEFSVQPVGTFSGSHAIENTTGSDSLGSCVARQIGSLRVNPGPSDAMTFSFPFVFRPQQ